MPRESNLKRREQPDEFDAPELMFAELDSLLGYLLRRAQGAMHRDFMAAVADFGLTQKQAATLWLIQANRRCIAGRRWPRRSGMDRATMMAVTDRLEDRGFVIRKRSSVDRRRQELYLTPVGAEHVAQVQDAHRRARREIPRDVHGVPNSRRCSMRSRNSKISTDPMTSKLVRVERDGELALIVVHNPPVNTITAEVRAGLARSARARSGG